MTILYGIKNCDTIKKAKTWLTQNDINFKFHDYRQDGLTEDWLQTAENVLGWEKMLNKRGTTFRQLTDQQKQGIDRESSLALMLEHPSMIKRPILVHQEQYHLAFKVEQYLEIFS